MRAIKSMYVDVESKANVRIDGKVSELLEVKEGLLFVFVFAFNHQ